MAFDLATARLVEPEEPADEPIEGRTLAGRVLGLHVPILRPVVGPVDLGAVQATPVHWTVPRASRWRCHCPGCRDAGAGGRRAFTWLSARG